MLAQKNMKKNLMNEEEEGLLEENKAEPLLHKFDDKNEIMLLPGKPQDEENAKEFMRILHGDAMYNENMQKKMEELADEEGKISLDDYVNIKNDLTNKIVNQSGFKNKDSIASLNKRIQITDANNFKIMDDRRINLLKEKNELTFLQGIKKNADVALLFNNPLAIKAAFEDTKVLTDAAFAWESEDVRREKEKEAKAFLFNGLAQKLRETGDYSYWETYTNFARASGVDEEVIKKEEQITKEQIDLETKEKEDSEMLREMNYDINTLKTKYYENPEKQKDLEHKLKVHNEEQTKKLDEYTKEIVLSSETSYMRALALIHNADLDDAHKEKLRSYVEVMHNTKSGVNADVDDIREVTTLEEKIMTSKLTEKDILENKYLTRDKKKELLERLGKEPINEADKEKYTYAVAKIDESDLTDYEKAVVKSMLMKKLPNLKDRDEAIKEVEEIVKHKAYKKEVKEELEKQVLLYFGEEGKRYLQKIDNWSPEGKVLQIEELIKSAKDSGMSKEELQEELRKANDSIGEQQKEPSGGANLREDSVDKYNKAINDNRQAIEIIQNASKPSSGMLCARTDGSFYQITSNGGEKAVNTPGKGTFVWIKYDKSDDIGKYMIVGDNGRLIDFKWGKEDLSSGNAEEASYAVDLNEKEILGKNNERIYSPLSQTKGIAYKYNIESRQYYLTNGLETGFADLMYCAGGLNALIGREDNIAARDKAIDFEKKAENIYAELQNNKNKKNETIYNKVTQSITNRIVGGVMGLSPGSNVVEILQSYGNNYRKRLQSGLSRKEAAEAALKDTFADAAQGAAFRKGAEQAKDTVGDILDNGLGIAK